MREVSLEDKEIIDLDAWLVQHGEENAEKIALELLRKMPDSSYSKIPRDAFLEGARANHWLSEGFLKESGFEWSGGTMSPRGLLESGVEISDVIQSLLITVDALPVIINNNYPPEKPLSDHAKEWFSNEVHKFVAGFISEVINESKKQIAEAHQRTSMMLEVAQTVNSTMDMDEILKLASSILTKSVGASHCWFFLSQTSEDSYNAPQLIVSPAMIHEPAPQTIELVQSILQTREIVVCSDTNAAEYAWAKLLGLKSVLGIPLFIRGQSLGCALIVNEKATIVSNTQLELIIGIANVVSNALGNAILLRKLQHLAILEERSKLAREIHDDLAQALGILNLKIRTILDKLETGDVQHAQVEIREMIQIGEKAYSASRESLFNLNSTKQITVRFLPWLRKYLADYQLYFGVKIALDVHEESTAFFLPEIEVQISWIITEALSNIRKHANASKVHIRFEHDHATTLITIEDDGLGFEPEKVQGGGKLHYGLQIMRERAESFGGLLVVNSLPQKGTTVIISIPRSGKMRLE